MPVENIALIGAGSWGTCLAALLAEKGHPVRLWVYEKELVGQILAKRENPLYLPGVKLSPLVAPTASLEEALKSATLVVLATPSHVFRGVLAQAVPHLAEAVPVVCVSKGIEHETLMLMSQVLREVLPGPFHEKIAVLSGPSFAKEVSRGEPTAVTLACEDPALGRKLAQVFITPSFKVFTATDLIGAQLGGALKNVIALAAGLVEGLGYGYNTRAALIARGLAEMGRLGAAMGADPRTFSGLSGLGDLVLTCTGGLSRNRQVGLKLGQGLPLSRILDEMREVAEGVQTARSAHALARKLGVRVPLMERVYAILFEGAEPRRALSDLLEGAGGPE